MVLVWVFNPSSQEAEVGGAPSSRPFWSTELVLGQPGYREKPCLKKRKIKKAMVSYSCLNKTWKVTLIDMLTWMRKNLKGLTLRTQGEEMLSRGESASISYQILKGQHWDYIHKGNIVWTDQAIFRDIHIKQQLNKAMTLKARWESWDGVKREREGRYNFKNIKIYYKLKNGFKEAQNIYSTQCS